MKPNAFTFAVVADQINSRADDDLVPAALAHLEQVPTVLPFERTAGDEIQGLLDSPDALVAAILTLTRISGWRVGVGLGLVDQPLPNSTRAARGPAYLAARAAITAARKQPTSFALRVAETVGGDRYGDSVAAGEAAETAVWLWRGVLTRRTPEGWELMDLLDRGYTKADAARELGISPSAVSQRLATAAREEGLRGAALCQRLFIECLTIAEGESA
ncbi:MAG: transposase [Actinobacteria bacterium HGW-Actinobacteria-2]|nr:MAG: transposase [Actinobacteria bacterium HGW-Actinobacteria-2]